MKRIISYMLMLVAFVAFSTPTFAQNNTKQRKTREQMVEAQAQHIAKTMAFDDATSTRLLRPSVSIKRKYGLSDRVNDHSARMGSHKVRPMLRRQ